VMMAEQELQTKDKRQVSVFKVKGSSLLLALLILNKCCSETR